MIAVQHVHHKMKKAAFLLCHYFFGPGYLCTVNQNEFNTPIFNHFVLKTLMFNI